MRPNWPAKSQDYPAIIGFRNLLIHGYAVVDDRTVWHNVQENLPGLRAKVTGLLDELGPPESWSLLAGEQPLPHLRGSLFISLPCERGRPQNIPLPCARGRAGVGAPNQQLFPLPCERERPQIISLPCARGRAGVGAKTLRFPLLFRVQARAAAGAKNPMNTTPESRLLELYDRVAEAPDAIERLRKFILDLAVRGKLLEQDPEDEPKPQLLDLVAEDKAGRLEPPLSKWIVTKLGNALNFQYGKGLKKSERLEEGPVPVFGSNGIVGFTTEALTDNPSIIVGRKGSAGALNLCDRPSWTTDVAYFVEAPQFFDLNYLFLALQALDTSAPSARA